jgi:MFS family permease
LTRYLVTSSGWKATFFFYGLLAWAVILPLALLIRDHPQDMGLLPYGGGPIEPPSGAATELTAYPFSTVLTLPAFWTIAVVHFLCCAAHSGPIFHMVSSVIDTGADKLAAATVFAVASLASIPGRVGTGLLADRFGSKTVLVAWLIMQATAILLYLGIGSFSGFIILALYFGIAYGGVMPLYAVVTREFFGDRAMGSSYGAIFLLSCFGMGLGAWLGGRIFDSMGTYQVMYALSFFLGLAGAVLAIWLRAPLAARSAVSLPHVLRAS